MSYKIIGDSCTDLTEYLKQNKNIALVPLTLQVDNEEILDDETFDQSYLLKRMKESTFCLKSACPSPEAFMKLYDSADDIFVVTLSGSLSGSYNSAQLARTMYLENDPNKNILVIDSCSASCGQTLIAMKAIELMEKGVSFEEASKQLLAFRDEMNTKFVLESLEVLAKNGRLSAVKYAIVNTLNIKAVMIATEVGMIDKIDQARGMKKALEKMVTYIEKDAKNPEEKIVGISHCNNYERALFVQKLILDKIPFKDSFIVDTAGVSTFYANDGGIIVSY